MTPPVALTIAGSDSGGGAGIQADLKTFAALGVFGTSAITAITAQNTAEVRCVEALAPALVVAQIEAVLDDLPVAAAKTGMLATATIVGAVAEVAETGRLPNLVVDPVLVSSSGARLMEPTAERAYLDELFPHATVVTPNLLEAGALLGRALTTVGDQRDAARALAELGPRVVVVKGGHAVADRVDDAVDVVWDGTHLRELTAPRVDTINTHGSGCSFAAATAAGLAQGLPIMTALERAKAFVHAAITRGARWHLGAGHGPLAHFREEEIEEGREDVR